MGRAALAKRDGPASFTDVTFGEITMADAILLTLFAHRAALGKVGKGAARPSPSRNILSRTVLRAIAATQRARHRQSMMCLAAPGTQVGKAGHKIWGGWRRFDGRL